MLKAYKYRIYPNNEQRAQIVFHLRTPKYRDEETVSKGMGMSCLWNKA